MACTRAARRYEEEVHPEEFFVPYCWNLVCAHSGIPWDASCVALFPPAEAAAQVLAEARCCAAPPDAPFFL